GSLRIGCITVVAVSLSALLAAQDPVASSPRDPLALIAAAEKAIAAGPDEGALLDLWTAASALRATAATTVGDAALQAIAALEPKADLACAERAAAGVAVGKKLLELARAYRGRNWFESAAALAQIAAALDA